MSAYSDNAAVMEGRTVAPLLCRPGHRPLRVPRRSDAHPDEGGDAQPPDGDLAVPRRGHRFGRRDPRRGRDRARVASPRPGLCGFSVSNLRIPGFERPWEGPESRPDRIASPLAIMIEGPIGAASFNNEFGRPNLAGLLPRLRAGRSRRRRAATTSRSCSPAASATSAPSTSHKADVPAGALLIQLGGPGMLIGMGGGAASSMSTGANTADLDFDSVQRGNAEIQRRAQEVIDRCWALGPREPDPLDPRRRRRRPVERAARARPRLGPRRAHRPARRAERGAGHDAARGLVQRGAGALRPRHRARTTSTASAPSASASAAPSPSSATRRTTTASSSTTRSSATTPVDMDLPALLGKPPRMTRDVARVPRGRPRFDAGRHRDRRRARPRAARAGRRRQDVPRLDRRPHGRRPLRARPDASARGRSRSPTAPRRCCRSTATRARRSPSASARRIASIDAPASGRMAVGEALTNLAAAPVTCAVAGEAVGQLDGGRRRARRGRRAVRHGPRRRARPVPCARHQHPGRQGLDVDAHDVDRRTASRAPSSARSRSSCRRSRRATTCGTTWTPQLRRDAGPTALVLIDLAAARRRLGGSILAQVYGETGDDDAGRGRPGRDPRPVRGPRRAARGRPRARVPRSVRRRADRDAARDGVRRPRRASTIDAEAVRPATGERPRWPASSPRNWARSSRSARPTSARVLGVARRAWPRRRASSAGRRRRPDHDPARRRGRCSATPASPCSAPGARRPGCCSRCATTPSRRSRNTTASWTPAIPGISPRPDVRSRRRRRRAVRRDGRAAADRDPARAGRERRGRDGGGVRPRRASRRTTST